MKKLSKLDVENLIHDFSMEESDLENLILLIQTIVLIMDKKK